MIFEDSPWSLEEAWRRVCHEHDEIVAVLGEEAGSMDCWLGSRWQPPMAGSIKLNVDGSYRDVEDSSGAGGLARDPSGNWLFGFLAHRRGGNAFMAEAQALLLGLELVWARGYRDIVVEVDCADLLQSLDDEDRRRFLPILGDIRNMKDRGWRISLERVRRDCNAPADYLAKLGARSPGVEYSFLEQPPWEVETLVMRDSLLAR